MKMKKFIFGLAICLMCFISVGNVYAEDTITYTGDAENFISLEGGAIDFENMFPGETRTVTFNLENGSDNIMRFYISSEILDNIAQKGDGTAVYDFTIDDGTDSIFEAIIGNNEVTIGSEFHVIDNHILLGELNPGESQMINVVLYIDGDSANNDYQGQTGEIEFAFSVEETLPVVPQTGDDAISPFIYGGLIAVAGIAVVVLVRKGDKNEK